MTAPTDAELERQYDNRGNVPEHPAIIAGWARDAEAYRAEAAARGEAALDIAYGPQERQKFDLFGPGARGIDAPLLMFIHGGYWRSLDRASFSHLAKGANAHGVTVALPSYRLCPAVSMDEIVDDLRAAALALWKRFGRRFAVAGHSAGGHLTACLVGTDWTRIDPSRPRDMTTAGYSVSGLFDLAPLTRVSVNADLRMDAAAAERLSPVRLAPPQGVVLDAVYGGDETAEYARQSRAIVEAWAAAGATTRLEALPGANHFTAPAPLSDPASAMTRRVVELARSV